MKNKKNKIKQFLYTNVIFHKFQLYLNIKNHILYFCVYAPIHEKIIAAFFFYKRIRQRQKEEGGKDGEKKESGGLLCLRFIFTCIRRKSPSLTFFFTHKSVLKRKLRDVDTISSNVRQRVTSDRQTLLAASGFTHKGIVIKQALHPQVIIAILERNGTVYGSSSLC